MEAVAAVAAGVGAAVPAMSPVQPAAAIRPRMPVHHDDDGVIAVGAAARPAHSHPGAAGPAT